MSRCGSSMRFASKALTASSCSACVARALSLSAAVPTSPSATLFAATATDDASAALGAGVSSALLASMAAASFSVTSKSGARFSFSGDLGA